MSFDSMLAHQLVIIRQVAEIDEDLKPVEDDYGHAVRSETEIGPFAGLIQPADARDREAPSTSQAGIAISDHRIYMRIRDIRTADAIRTEPDDRRRFEVVGVDRFDFGTVPHMRIRARLAATGALPEGS